MKAGQRLWRTADGGLVLDGDLAARTLAYAAGDDLARTDESRVPGSEDDAQEKARTASPNKSRRPQGNKSGG
jgi:hypothetical protein